MRNSSSHHTSLWPRVHLQEVWVQHCFWNRSSLKLKWNTVILHRRNRWCIFLRLISYAVPRLQRVRGNPGCLSATCSSPQVFCLCSTPPQTVGVESLLVGQRPAQSGPDLCQDFGSWRDDSELVMRGLLGLLLDSGVFGTHSWDGKPLRLTAGKTGLWHLCSPASAWCGVSHQGRDGASFRAPQEVLGCDGGLLRPPQILEKLSFQSVI